MDIVRVKKQRPLIISEKPVSAPMDAEKSSDQNHGNAHSTTPPTTQRPQTDFSYSEKESRQFSKQSHTKIIIIALMIAITFSVFGYWYWKNAVLLNTQGGNELGFFQLVGQVITGGNSIQIKGEKRGRTNFYLMGIADEKHDGSTLSDSNIVLSINHETKELAIIHLPRDMELKINGLGYRKLNSVHAIGEAIQKGSGPVYASEIISQTLSLPIDYYLRINFSGVVEVIDALGGVGVNVENTFTDYKYPDTNNGYMTVTFNAGNQTMDGQTLLQYVRSRHSAENNEGSDFARGKRQMRALEAVKNKIESLSILTDSDLMLSILSIINKSAKTNMKSAEALRLYNIVKDIPSDHIFSTALDNSAYGLLMDVTNDDGAYALIPTDSTYNKIQEYLRTIFSLNSLEKERASIVVRNGNGIPGEAGVIGNKLARKNLRVLKSENADNFDYTESVIYDLSNGKKPETLKTLKELLPRVNVSSNPPDFIRNSGDNSSDFVILLGNDLSYQN